MKTLLDLLTILHVFPQIVAGKLFTGSYDGSLRVWDITGIKDDTTFGRDTDKVKKVIILGSKNGNSKLFLSCASVINVLFLLANNMSNADECVFSESNFSYIRHGIRNFLPGKQKFVMCSTLFKETWSRTG